MQLAVTTINRSIVTSQHLVWTGLWRFHV